MSIRLNNAKKKLYEMKRIFFAIAVQIDSISIDNRDSKDKGFPMFASGMRFIANGKPRSGMEDFISIHEQG